MIPSRCGGRDAEPASVRATHHIGRITVADVELALRDPGGCWSYTIKRKQAAERQASAGARDGVKGNRRSPAARAPLHALVMLRPE